MPLRTPAGISRKVIGCVLPVVFTDVGESGVDECPHALDGLRLGCSDDGDAPKGAACSGLCVSDSFTYLSIRCEHIK